MPWCSKLLRTSFIMQQNRWDARDSVSQTRRYYEITCAITGKLRGLQTTKAICVSQSVFYQEIFLQETLRQLWFSAFTSKRFVFSLQIKHAQQNSYFRHFQYVLETGKHSTKPFIRKKPFLFLFDIHFQNNTVAIRSRRISANAVTFRKQYFCGLAFYSRVSFYF